MIGALVGAAVFLGVLFSFAHPWLVVLNAFDWASGAKPLSARIALLEPAVDVQTPDDGEGPFPLAIQFHGCAGPRAPFQQQWADVALSAGYAVMIVDSVGPRGFDREGALDKVCTGKTLLGQERAGDVLAAIAMAARDERIDRTKIVLAGWSHGGWSIMDYFAYGDKAPAGVAAPAAGAAFPALDIAGAVFVYPYCGPAARSRYQAWEKTPPLLAIVAGADTMVDPKPCIAFFEERKTAGDPVNLVVYPNAEHVFDDPYLEPDYIEDFDAGLRDDAVEKYRSFLLGLR
ncbi:MAG: prolyl oligopeptidase family serine peptidase [Pseudomonadota bacterium]